MENELKPYTIVGYYADESRAFASHVMAKNVKDSVIQWCKEREPKKLFDDIARKFWRGNVRIVDIFEGRLVSLQDCGHVCDVNDYTGQYGKEIE